MLLLIFIGAMLYWFDFKAVIVTHDWEQRCSAGNNMWSSDIVWPNFENAWPIAHYDCTWWLNMMTEHLPHTSWVIFFKVLSVNEFCPVKFVKCWTKRMIWKDIILCPVNKENFFSSTGDGSMYCFWGVFFAFKFSKEFCIAKQCVMLTYALIHASPSLAIWSKSHLFLHTSHGNLQATLERLNFIWGNVKRIIWN